jgi:NAD(P)-dependent dehydrogenase (short-subunit alcohol dehydrogenase family)
VHLVHNTAGVEVGGPLWAVSGSQWRWILGVNLWGVIHGIRVFVPLLMKQAAGHVVNTTSLAGLSSPALMGPYNATKHGVVTISEMLYRDLQLKESPVGVSVLCPGYVRTGITDSHRNRPTWVDQADSALAERGRAAARQFVEGGIAAEIIRRNRVCAHRPMRSRARLTRLVSLIARASRSRSRPYASKIAATSRVADLRCSTMVETGQTPDPRWPGRIAVPLGLAVPG